MSWHAFDMLGYSHPINLQPRVKECRRIDIRLPLSELDPRAWPPALALGRTGIETQLLGPLAQRPHATPDRRTAALFAGSIELLKNLGVWDDVAAESEPITAIRMIDDTGSLLRAPEVTFTAAELGLAEFGWNIPNRVLVAALSRAVTAPESNVRIIETEAVTSLKLDGPEALLTTKEGQEASAALVVAADGRNSLCRQAADIETRAWTYPQAAVAAWFTHTRPHGNISTEFHRAAGPFTTVPLPGLASSLVWVEKPEEAQRLAALDDYGFRQALELRLQGLLGSVGEISPRTVFPLSGLTAKTSRTRARGACRRSRPCHSADWRPRPEPGLRDAAVLADCVAEATVHKKDPGSPAVLDPYEVPPPH